MRVTAPAAALALAVAVLALAGPARAGAVEDVEAGLAAARAGNYEAAIPLFSRAIDTGKLSRENLVITYDNRGNAFVGKRLYYRAIADYTEALKLAPEYANAYNGRGNAYADKGLDDQAIADYSRAIELRPKHMNAYYNRGVAYHKIGRYRRAVADYTAAWGLRPHPDHLRGRCLAYEKLGRLEEARRDCARALRRNPRDGRARRALARLGRGT